MPRKRGARIPSTTFPLDTDPNDNALIDRIKNGDDAALRMLMDRYDRLIRYTIFRTARRQCMRDPQWLDAVASDCWTGLIQSLRRHSTGSRVSLPGFLSTIARNQTISALRRIPSIVFDGSQSVTAEESPEDCRSAPEPGELLSDIDSLEILRRCLDQLPDAERVVFSQLDAITRRQWTDAAKALGLSESTLRSKWTRILGLLKECMDGKTGDFVAPGEIRGD